ncbi:TIM barrel protein [Maridesulfovibrio sp.]|uniref:sugar phosphate isomerase/epimerase family protein n=1 Tax=Maridesulfovibrio sp. TaxID=2795000 RepID=UPI002AA6E93B|nr:TIM barrel protein [Maridesulfovibrio sp.]
MAEIETELYISSSCFKKGEFAAILDTVSTLPATGLELSHFSGAIPDLATIQQQADQKKCKLLVHNYFPPPENHFVMNLASDSAETLEQSILLAEKAIRFCRKANIPFYSVHCGFACNAAPEDLGKPLASLQRIPLQNAMDIFVQSLKKICSYAQRMGVKIAIENHTVSSFNLVNGENKLLPGATPDELLKIVDSVHMENLGLLLDLGHLKITSRSMGFDLNDAIKKLSSRTLAIHIHDNNGIYDEHLPMTESSWFLDLLANHFGPNVKLVMESNDQTADSLAKQIQILKKVL